MSINCNYCLCQVCNKSLCPRGKYHCMPCYHGCILECDFFRNKLVNKIYRFSRNDTADGEKYITLRARIEQENIRHRKALSDIVRKYKYRDK